jgi:predicted ATPase
MLPVSELATTAVQALVPYLSAAAMEGAKKLGPLAVERLAGLYDKMKIRVRSPAGQEALAELAKTPEDADAQGALRLALRKQLAEDPSFHTELAALVEEISRLHPAVVQTSAITGDGNLNAQISGSGNQVGPFGKSS